MGLDHDHVGGLPGPAPAHLPELAAAGRQRLQNEGAISMTIGTVLARALDQLAKGIGLVPNELSLRGRARCAR